MGRESAARESSRASVFRGERESGARESGAREREWDETRERVGEKWGKRERGVIGERE